MVRVGLGVGLIETMRARDGHVPWLDRHLARLRGSLAAQGLASPVGDLRWLVLNAAGRGGDIAVRLEVRVGRAKVTTRDVNTERGVAVVVSDQPYSPYPHKTTRREQFDRALADAHRAGADDALLVTVDGYVAEGTTWNVFWWDNGTLHTPAAELGVLPGIGRNRVMELTGVREARVPVSALVGRSLFLVNAVRGVVAIGSLQGEETPRDPRTSELSSVFWPD